MNKIALILIALFMALIAFVVIKVVQYKSPAALVITAIPAKPERPEQLLPIPAKSGQALPAPPPTNMQTNALSFINPAMLEMVDGINLPIIASDGTMPSRAYAAKFNDQTALPRIAIIINNIGLQNDLSRKAIDNLPPEVTMAINPYGQNLVELAGLANKRGHEYLIELPMEPIDFPTNDPGPKALFSDFSPEQNIENLYWVMSQVQGYVGLIADQGSRFASDGKGLLPIVTELKKRGLMLVDNKAADNSSIAATSALVALPNAEVTMILGDGTNNIIASNIADNLARLEKIANINGVAIVLASSNYPVTIEALRSWTNNLAERGFILTPVTALANVASGIITAPNIYEQTK